MDSSSSFANFNPLNADRVLANHRRQFADATENGRLALISSPAAIDEFMDVVKRPAFHDLISSSDADQLGNLLRRAELFSPSHTAGQVGTAVSEFVDWKGSQR